MIEGAQTMAGRHSGHQQRPRVHVVQGGRVHKDGRQRPIVQPHAVRLAAQRNAQPDLGAGAQHGVRRGRGALGGQLGETESGVAARLLLGKYINGGIFNGIETTDALRQLPVGQLAPAVRRGEGFWSEERNILFISIIRKF